MGTKVFVSYSHDSDSHREFVLDRVNMMRDAGIECVIDRGIVSPPEGWPKWMHSQIENADFVLVVCTETYRRRFEGKEEKGIGVGATWEGAIITQEIYESAGHNAKYIPVLARQEDSRHIPTILAGQTRFRLDLPDDVRALYGHLTGQTDGALRPIGESVPLARINVDPTTDNCDRAGDLAEHFVSLCPSGLPIKVLAAMTSSEEGELRDAVLTQARLSVDDDLVFIAPHTRPIPEELNVIPSDARADLARKLIEFLQDHPFDKRFLTFARNATQMGKCTRDSHPKTMLQLFGAVEKPLKRMGRKKLVFDSAKLTISATHHDRTDADIPVEAKALICGTSWALQRNGQLDDALASAKRSIQIGNPENQAFCLKCMGRLMRMFAEEPSASAEERRIKFKESESKLRNAIDAFGKLDGFGEDHPEVGDCYSLLGRTYLSQGRRAIQSAAHAARRANALVDSGGKDRLDLDLLFGDIDYESREFQECETRCTEVIERHNPEDAQESEIAARAYLSRGKSLAQLGRREAANCDLESAKAIAERTGDRRFAAKAQWVKHQVNGDVDKDANEFLSRESITARVIAVRMYLEKLSAMQGRSLGYRKKLDPSYWKRLIRAANEEDARLDIPWQ